MALQRAPLNAQFAWAAVLPALGVAVTARALPARFDCPLCRGPGLGVHDDLQFGGQWYACPACGFAGDAVDLAGRVLNVPPLAAVQALARATGRLAGADPDDLAARVAADRRVYAGGRAAAQAFWAGCQRLDDSGFDYGTPAGELLLRRYGLQTRPRRADWPDRGGRLVGFSTRPRLEELLAPRKLASRRSGSGRDRHNSLGGEHRLFRGSGWGPLLVIPCADLPGRIHGFLVIGRSGGVPDRRYARVVPLPPDRQNHGALYETGLAFLDAGLAAPEGARVAAPVDLEAALALHLAHLDDHPDLLPLVAGLDLPPWRTRAAWRALAGRVPVHCGDPADPVLYRQARRSAGLVSRCPRAWLPGLVFPSTHVREVCAAAHSWPAALEQALRGGAAAGAGSLLLDVHLAPEDLGAFLAGCPPDDQDRLAGLAAAATAGRAVACRGRTVLETPAGWYLADRHGRPAGLISDMVLRIDQVVWQPRRGRAVYRGRIQFRGDEIPWADAVDAFARNPFARMRDRLLEAGRGVPTFDPGWSPFAVALAQQFQAPRYVRGRDAVGWDPAVGFVFPGYVQGRDGTVEPQATLVPAGPGPLPCAAFEPPGAPGSAECAAALAAVREALAAPGDAPAVVLAVAAVVVAQALDPAAAGHLALAGPLGTAAGVAAAEACGCVRHPVRTGRDARPSGVAARLDRDAGDQAWPLVVVPQEPRASLVPPRLLTALPVPAIAPVGPVAALVLALQAEGAWHVLHAPAAVDLGKLQKLAGRCRPLLPLYLADLCRRGLPLPAGASPHAVLADLGAFLGGDAVLTAVRARGLLRPAGPDGQLRALADLVDALLADGTLTAALGPVPDAGGDAVVRGGARWFVPGARINRALRAQFSLTLDLETTAGRLRAAGVDCTLAGRGDRDGWRIAARVFDDRARRTTTPHQEPTPCDSSPTD